MTTNPTPKTYREAIELGYTRGAQSLRQGYVSRKSDPQTAPIEVAGGCKEGELYVSWPNWRSTRYYIRQYLTPPQSK